MYKNAHLYTVTLKKENKWRTMINFFFVKYLKKRDTSTYAHLHILRKPKGIILQTVNSVALGVQSGG